MKKTFNESSLSNEQIKILTAALKSSGNILISGPTGSGKSFLATQILNYISDTNENPSITKVNLATLSPNLIESELFGHEKGSFTGAENRRVGRLEAANGGVIFLDEIGELPLAVQVKLLDFIQYKKITPVGSNREIYLNTRVVAATNRDLKSAISKGEFREDLYHRLNVFHIKVEPLALRKDILLNLADSFLKEKCHQIGCLHFLSHEIKKIFQEYSWPGNIRELENTIEYAHAFSLNSAIGLECLSPDLQLAMGLSTSEQKIIKCSTQLTDKDQNNCIKKVPEGILISLQSDFHSSKNSFEKAYLEFALKTYKGRVNMTSRMIGLNKVSLSEKMKKYQINWRDYK